MPINFRQILVRDMIRSLAVVLALATVLAANAADERDNSGDRAIRKGLAFLTQDALAWKRDHNCVSCHHAGLVVQALQAGRQQGFDIDRPVLDELTRWMTPGEGRTGVPRPEGIPNALNMKAVYFALALSADPEPDEEARQALGRFVKTMASDQNENGSWSAWPDTRPPMFGGSNDSMTALATLALASSGVEAAAGPRDRGFRWLASTKTDNDAQSLALRLMVWNRLKRSDDERRVWVALLHERQADDGGWRQTKEMPSDAWATGQALFALADSGLANKERLARGRAFLIRTQRDDGSWPMTSRPGKPGDKGADLLVPITGAGSAWAMLGLARSR